MQTVMILEGTAGSQQHFVVLLPSLSQTLLNLCVLRARGGNVRMRGAGIPDKFLSVLAVDCNPGGVSKWE